MQNFVTPETQTQPSLTGTTRDPNASDKSSRQPTVSAFDLVFRNRVITILTLCLVPCHLNQLVPQATLGQLPLIGIAFAAAKLLLFLAINACLLWVVYKPYTTKPNRYSLFFQAGAFSIAICTGLFGLAAHAVMPSPFTLWNFIIGSMVGTVIWLFLLVPGYYLRCFLLAVTGESQPLMNLILITAVASIALFCAFPGIRDFLVNIRDLRTLGGYQVGCLNPYVRLPKTY